MAEYYAAKQPVKSFSIDSLPQVRNTALAQFTTQVEMQDSLLAQESVRRNWRNKPSLKD